MIDYYGRFWPDYPGQPDPRFFPQSQQTQQQPAGQSAKQAPPAPAQTPVETVTMDIIPIDSESEIDHYIVQPGKTQMFATRDEKTIITVSRNANVLEKVYYDRRKPDVYANGFDPRAYPTRDEVTAYIDERLSALQVAPRASAKKGAQE